MLIASVSTLSYIYDSPTRCTHQLVFAFIMCLLRCLEVLRRLISPRGAQESCEQRRQPAAIVRSNLFEINVSTLF